MNSPSNQTPNTIAISVSESPDMAELGLGDEHLKQASSKIAMFLLAKQKMLAYGGDLRQHGFTKLLFDLSLRYGGPDVYNQVQVINYLAWPVHIRMNLNQIETVTHELQGAGRLALMGIDGTHLTIRDRRALPRHEPTDNEWSVGLTAMRRTMCKETDARILLGGRVEGYLGCMPGIAEEALQSLEKKQPVFLLGGFGGCTRDISETLGFKGPRKPSHSAWLGRRRFERFSTSDLNNGLSEEENRSLASTAYVDQAIMLILRGLYRLGNNLAV